MKICGYCGRENEDVATHCAECCTTEFVSANPRPPPEKFGPMISRRTKVAFLCTAIALIAAFFLFLGLGGDSFEQSPLRPAISFPTKAILASNGLSVVVSNQSDSKIVYLAYPLQVKSNGTWMDGPRPAGPLMMLTLAAHETATNTIAASLEEGVIYRVPILWGYTPSLRQIMRHKALNLLNSRNAGLTLETTTNFTDELSLP
jgi:hypothetical protein